MRASHEAQECYGSWQSIQSCEAKGAGGVQCLTCGLLLWKMLSRLEAIGRVLLTTLFLSPFASNEFWFDLFDRTHL